MLKEIVKIAVVIIIFVYLLKFAGFGQEDFRIAKERAAEIAVDTAHEAGLDKIAEWGKNALNNLVPDRSASQSGSSGSTLPNFRPKGNGYSGSQGGTDRKAGSSREDDTGALFGGGDHFSLDPEHLYQQERDK